MRKIADLSTVKSVENIKGKTGDSEKHESAHLHVSGEALYVDDRLEFPNQLHVVAGTSTIAHGRIKSMDLAAVRTAEGVVDVITAADVPGQVDIGPVWPGDPILVLDNDVQFYGQALFAVAATSHRLAQQAAKLAKIEYEELEPILDPDVAAAQEHFVRPPHSHRRGDAQAAIAAAPRTLEGSLRVGGQEHYYLEGQVSSVVPTEDGIIEVFTSSQNPSEIAIMVAEVLGVPENKVVAEMRRMGGGFGGKETQAGQWACLAAVLAMKHNRPVKARLSRRDDMCGTGKRHPFSNHYRVGFDDEGQLRGVQMTLNGDAGCSPDLTDAIVDRAMFHSDNAYYLDQAELVGNRCKTHKVSNTAFRGFGGPKGVITIECIMEEIARNVGKDPLDVRKLNLYGIGERNVTHYHQTVENNLLPELIDRLEASSNYRQRREDIKAFNAQSPVLKKGLSLNPVKFGISFTVQHLNQAGALVHIYTDGSIHLNHGGTEMGQGLYTKVAQVVAEEFQVNISKIQVSATRNDKVPNTSPTAASSGADLNGKAAQNAARTIKERLIKFAAEHYKTTEDQVNFRGGRVFVGEKSLPFDDFAMLAYQNRVQLSSTGYYRTPKIHYDRETASGRPFFYFSNGAAVSEVLVDTLTGEYKVLRVDILHDVGRSLNPAIDIGQIEGAFIQGMGWVTTEELVWDKNGRLLSDGAATYKIPAISDTPPEFHVELMSHPNAEDTIYNSKAVGEPPLMLGISVWSAIRDAVSSLSDYRVSPNINAPATPEEVLKGITELQQAQV